MPADNVLVYLSFEYLVLVFSPVGNTNRHKEKPENYVCFIWSLHLALLDARSIRLSDFTVKAWYNQNKDNVLVGYL